MSELSESAEMDPLQLPTDSNFLTPQSVLGSWEALIKHNLTDQEKFIYAIKKWPTSSLTYNAVIHLTDSEKLIYVIKKWPIIEKFILNLTSTNLT